MYPKSISTELSKEQKDETQQLQYTCLHVYRSHNRSRMPLRTYKWSAGKMTKQYNQDE